MKFRNYLALFAILIICVACPNDEDDGITTVEARDRGEQSITDDALIREFLETHFYNYEEFENPPADFDFKVVIDTIEGDNSDKTPIIDMPQLTTKTYVRSDADQTLYILTARQGDSEAPPATIADSTFLTYNGYTLTEPSFFDTAPNPVWFDLTTTVDGFTNGIADFKGSENGAVVNQDGTVSFDGVGSGAIFIPSGLGFFNSTAGGTIDLYSNLVFTFNIINVVRSDHDDDGIYSIDEDLDNNGFLFDDLDNPDDDIAFAYLDPDDDNDGVTTNLEIVTDENNDFISSIDTDGDGIPNHLDDDDDGDGRDTINEIAINATTGAITFPDEDEDGIPDYLDSDS